MNIVNKYDVIVVGAGHAGCEAAYASAKMGCRVLLITMDINRIAQMSCNPAVGGIAKGQIVREIDALGGGMGIVTDRTAIQFRMLNEKKGPAMWSPRSQCDRKLFINEWLKLLLSVETLQIWQDTVSKLLFKNGQILGVHTLLGLDIHAHSVILTNGTFLNGLLHFGKVKFQGGRISEPNIVGLSDQLKSIGFQVSRMKTGTPCRLDGRSIDFSSMIEQKGEISERKFCFLPNVRRALHQCSCWITYTNETTHNILRSHLHESPLYNGQIQSIGPRYCPSVETKIITFADKPSHQLFIEPEGVDSNEYYVNGFSSSLPYDVQLEALRTVKGLEKCVFYRPGYAIEYDFFNPQQLLPTLETKLIQNLYFAGQINGTTGYEEAAGQGIIAGINAALSCFSSIKEFILNRDEAYIGVLIDDLINKGVDEPYRMFTSRAEYRILLRQDNADERLTHKSYNLGLADLYRYNIYSAKTRSIQSLYNFIKSFSVEPSLVNPYLDSIGSSLIRHKVKLLDLLLRPNISIDSLSTIIPALHSFCDSLETPTQEVIQSAEIALKYEGYLNREKLLADKNKRLSNLTIPPEVDYSNILSLSTEARQKLQSVRPVTIGQASRIPGVSPNDISVLLVLLGR
mgnify:CR=1 FL=1